MGFGEKPVGQQTEHTTWNLELSVGFLQNTLTLGSATGQNSLYSFPLKEKNIQRTCAVGLVMVVGGRGG